MNSAAIAGSALKRPIVDINGPMPAMANGPVVQKRKLLTTEMKRFRHNRELPLNLILLITAHLDDIADISRVTRTSKLLYYMTLPRLWENVTLRCHSELRYKNGLPEGYGGGSPFSMALDAMVSRNVGAYVKSLKLIGEWREMDVDEFSKGRVPDNTMMLNISIRAALDKIDKLQSFSWELNTKPLRMIYQALSSKKTLTHLTLKFPSSRIARPTVILPPIPSLRYLHVYDIDPLCYPDDISLLLGNAINLQEIKMEWSPRMRRERESSVSLHSYFGRAASANIQLPVKRLTYKNMYTRNDEEVSTVLDPARLEEMTFLNCVNPGDPSTVFIDETWCASHLGVARLGKLKKLRIDVADESTAQALAEISGLEEFYLVDRYAAVLRSNPTLIIGSPALETSYSAAVTKSGDKNTSNSTPITPTTPHYQLPASVTLGSEFVAAISTNHGYSLRILLLSYRWKLCKEALSHLTKSCPNLCQLGVAIDGEQFQTLKAILPFCPKLFALRILEGFEMHATVMEKMREIRDAAGNAHVEILGREVYKEEYKNVRYFGLGPMAFEFGRIIECGQDGVKKRFLKYLTWDEAKKTAEIFGMDSLDV